MKKTKIIATIGPASIKKEVLKELILNGMDIARINLAYADGDFCKEVVSKINELNKELNTYVSIMFDLKGPDVNVLKFAGGKAFLKQGDTIRIYDQNVLGDNTKFSVSYEHFVREVDLDTIIKINDGLVELQVVGKTNDNLICEVKKEGYVEDYKSINVIDKKLKMPFISKKDREDIKLACDLNIDFLSLSFISSYEDVMSINDILIELDNDHIAIIPKIENERALEDIDDIIKISDGVMIARGDLGAEIPMERIPGIQKIIINKCHTAGKVSIVATEMLSTMENVSRPTRAEVSDVANAVIDGVDNVMLSGETTIGKYPAQTVAMMNKIVTSAEEDINYYEFLDKTMRTEKQDITGSIAHSVVECSNRLKCEFIVTPTMSGYTAKKISRFRPKAVILALSPDINTVKELNMYYGVYPILIDELKSFDEIMIKSKQLAKKLLKEEKGKIIITGGYPFSDTKHTNFMKIEEL